MWSCAWQNTAWTGTPSARARRLTRFDQVLADLEPDVLARRIARGALEQELRVGAADLELDRPAVERRAHAAELREVHLVAG